MYVIGVLQGTVLGLSLFLTWACSTLSFESLESFQHIASYVLWQAKLHLGYPLNHKKQARPTILPDFHLCLGIQVLCPAPPM